MVLDLCALQHYCLGPGVLGHWTPVIQDTVSLVQSPVKSVEKALMNVMGFASSLRSTVLPPYFQK